MHRRFSIVVNVPELKVWRCVGCQVPLRAAEAPQGVKACGDITNFGGGIQSPRASMGRVPCGAWLDSETLDNQLPMESLVRTVVETVVAVGWGLRQCQPSEQFIRAAVSAALTAEVQGYGGHEMTWEDDALLFRVRIAGMTRPVLYRFAWPDWTPKV